MKKKLLFSLLLGSSFVWMNVTYAADLAKPQVSSSDNGKGAESSTKPAAKKYKVTDLDGSTKEGITFFTEEDYKGKTKFLNFQDGGIYDPSGKQNFPYMAGEKMPQGHAVVYVGRKKGSDNELKFFPADADIGKFISEYDFKQEEWWMYFDGQHLYPYKEKEDPNAQLILSKKASVYEYEVPDEATTKLQQELAASKEQLAKGGGASSEQVKALQDQIAQMEKSPSAASLSANGVLSKVIQFKASPEMEPLSFVVNCTTKAALDNPSLFFDGYIDSLNKLFNKCPQVVAYMLCKMLEDKPLDNQSLQLTGNFKPFRWESKNGLVAEIILAPDTNITAVNDQIKKIFEQNAALDEAAVKAHIDELHANAEKQAADEAQKSREEREKLEAEKAQLQAELEAVKTVAAEAVSSTSELQQKAQAFIAVANANGAEGDRLAKELTSANKEVNTARTQLEVEEAERQRLEQEKLKSDAENTAVKEQLEKEEAERQRLEQEKLAQGTVSADGSNAVKVEAEKTHAPAQQLDNVPAPATEVPAVKTHDVPLNEVPAVKTHDVPLNEVPAVKTHDVPLNEVPAVKTHDVPVAEVPAVKTHDVPVNEVPAVKTHDVPLNEVPAVKTHDVPLNEVPSVKTHDVPVAEVSAVKTHDVPVAEVSAVKTHDVPVAEVSAVKTHDVPVAEVSAVKTHDVPLNEVPAVKTHDVPVAEVPAVKTHDVPVTTKNDEINIFDE